MYPLHSFSPYNKGKACSRDSVSHNCNFLILREKTVYPYTLLTSQYTVFKRKKAQGIRTLYYTVLSHIMVYGSTPYVGMALKKMATTLSVDKSGGVGQDHVQQLLLTLHLFHYGVFHREKKHMVATNAFIF